MSHFAEIDPITKIVKRVIVIEQEEINTGKWGDPKNWIQTSYNTYGGVNERTGIPIRKNFASTGFKYDKEKDAFIPPQPYNSWILNDETCLWEAPIPKPDSENFYEWNENTLSWEIVE